MIVGLTCERSHGRADLVAQFTSTYLGPSFTHLVDKLTAQKVAQACLAFVPVATLAQASRCIAAGVKRGQDIRAAHAPAESPGNG